MDMYTAATIASQDYRTHPLLLNEEVGVYRQHDARRFTALLCGSECWCAALTAAFCGPRVIGSLASFEPLPPQIRTPPVNAASKDVANVVSVTPSVRLSV